MIVRTQGDKLEGIGLSHRDESLIGVEQEATESTELNGEGAGFCDTGKTEDLKTTEEPGENAHDSGLSGPVC